MTFSGMAIKCRYANEYHPTVFLFSSHPFLSVSVASCCLFLLALKQIITLHYRFYTKLSTQDL